MEVETCEMWSGRAMTLMQAKTEYETSLKELRVRRDGRLALARNKKERKRARKDYRQSRGAIALKLERASDLFDAEHRRVIEAQEHSKRAEALSTAAREMAESYAAGIMKKWEILDRTSDLAPEKMNDRQQRLEVARRNIADAQAAAGSDLGFNKAAPPNIESPGRANLREELDRQVREAVAKHFPAHKLFPDFSLRGRSEASESYRSSLKGLGPGEHYAGGITAEASSIGVDLGTTHGDPISVVSGTQLWFRSCDTGPVVKAGQIEDFIAGVTAPRTAKDPSPGVQLADSDPAFNSYPHDGSSTRMAGVGETLGGWCDRMSRAAEAKQTPASELPDSAFDNLVDGHGGS